MKCFLIKLSPENKEKKFNFNYCVEFQWKLFFFVTDIFLHRVGF